MYMYMYTYVCINTYECMYKYIAGVPTFRLFSLLEQECYQLNLEVVNKDKDLEAKLER